ncbi:hypothetical protein Nstercoris_01674 [Nitrosomonas stercoris]|uniref:Phospholipid-binding protein MlaC n=1 Tax=Nitrosomonas stercoris TaxID=1444684 RepID=A0A4Y1YNL7_9PROT|nr:hypothetical protein Nstercoris_01674 [Nitrosomonas stercoris]
MAKLLLAVTLIMATGSLQAEAPETSENSEAKQVVSVLQDGLIQAMRQGQKNGYSGRQQLLAPIIEQTHDLAFVVRSVLGSHWIKLDADQQQTITRVFQENSIATYADRFDQYDQEQFVIIDQTQLPRNRLLVRSQLTRLDDKPVNFDYVMDKSSGSWRIINILVDGVSDLALKRAEYGSILQKDGITALIDLLQNKTASIEQRHQ